MHVEFMFRGCVLTEFACKPDMKQMNECLERM